MFKLLSKAGGQSSSVIPGCIQADDMREQWSAEETNLELEGIFLLARRYQLSLITRCQLGRSYLHNTFTPRLRQRRGATKDSDRLQPILPHVHSWSDGYFREIEKYSENRSYLFSTSLMYRC